MLLFQREGAGAYLGMPLGNGTATELRHRGWSYKNKRERDEANGASHNPVPQNANGWQTFVELLDFNYDKI